jgi:CHASE2 domain-containing sensor protein
VSPEAFRDKVIVIGFTARSHPELRKAPLSGDRGMPGAELQANALDTMLRGEPLRDASPLFDVLAIILLACLPAAAGLARSRRRVVAAIAVGAIAFLAAAQLAFQAGRIIAVAMPLVALIAAALGVAALTVARAVRRAHRR